MKTSMANGIPAVFLAGLISLCVPQIGLSQSATITTIAGTGSPFKDITDGMSATAASVPYPFDLDIDAQDNVYFVYGDNIGVNGTPDIYRISKAGQISLAFRLTPYFNLTFADGVAISSAGDVAYVTNSHALSGLVVKLTSSVQGTVGGGYQFSFPITPPAGIRLRNGQIYVTDPGHHRVVRIGSDNSAVVIAGTGVAGYDGDGGPATQAKFNFPEALAVDATGNVFVADTFNSCVRKISTSGIVTTLAGTCTKEGFSGDGGLAVAAKLFNPRGVAVDPNGTVYIADTDNSRIRRINDDGTIETIAGGANILGDGGPATRAMLYTPQGMAFDSQGRMYIADTNNHRIRMLTFGAAPTPLAPQIANNGIVNGASFQAPVARGAWTAIFGQKFTTGTSRIWTGSDFNGNKLPTSLDGVSVTFNDIDAAVYYISSTQLNVQVPDGLPAGEVTVKVKTPNGTSVSGVQHQPISPGLFTIAQVQSSTGMKYFYPAAVHTDGTFVGRPNVIPGSRPAVAGEIILVYGTGFGPSNPPQPSGVIVSTSFLDSLPIFTFGDQRGLVEAAALVSAGLYQFNIKVPAGVNSNTDYLLQVGFLGGLQSQASVYLPIN